MGTGFEACRHATCDTMLHDWLWALFNLPLPWFPACNDGVRLHALFHARQDDVFERVEKSGGRLR